MGENLPFSSSQSSLSPFADSDGWINPRRQRNPGDGGGSGDVDSTPSSPPPPIRFHRRKRPDPSTSTDPYWIRGGLLPQCVEDLSDDEADLSYLGDGLFGRDKVVDSPEMIENRVVGPKKTVIDVRRCGNLRCPPTAVTIPASSGSAGDVEDSTDSTEYELLISTADQGKWDECVAEAEEWVNKMFPESESESDR